MPGESKTHLSVAETLKRVRTNNAEVKAIVTEILEGLEAFQKRSAILDHKIKEKEQQIARLHEQ
jgi:hypothetical protein